MKIWKCYNCVGTNGVPGVDFIAEQPVCPTCSTDGTQPRFKHLLVACKVIHFDPPHPTVENRGLGELACGTPWKGKRASGAPVAVNCPACKATPIYAQHIAADDDETVTIPQGD